MNEPEVWTILRLLTWTTDFLKKKGFDSPRLEAEVLLAHARGCRRIELYTSFEEQPPEEVRTRFRALVKRRAEGTPVAYLVGSKEFFSLSFEVGPQVLIPRPETEFVVLGVLDFVKRHPQLDPVWMADLGTGSGAIAVASAKNAPKLRCLAVDKSPGALEIAAKNVVAHNLGERVELLKSDWFAAVPPERRFHIVASNPPYVASDEMGDLPPDVRDFEPHSALEAGPEGLDDYRRLIPQAAQRLLPGGLLLLEIGPRVEKGVLAAITAAPELSFVKVVKDYGHRPRVVYATRK